MTLREYAALVDHRLGELLPRRDMPLDRAMRYSVFAGGKRLRPALLLAACDLFGGDRGEALDFACAVEMIHTYSLIHDDLPGMDDDGMRRGKPTNHIVFGVGQAILAGDGLLNLAFEAMLDRALASPGRESACMRAMAEIARGAGVWGMIGGQCLDLMSERGGVEPDGRADMLMRIHAGKTAAMFVHPMRAACNLAGASDADMSDISEYARAFGMLFQATDDLLDATGTSAALGKTVGKDERDGKLTHVSVYGVDETRRRAHVERDRAVRALARFGERAAFLRALVDSMADRTT